MPIRKQRGKKGGRRLDEGSLERAEWGTRECARKERKEKEKRSFSEGHGNAKLSPGTQAEGRQEAKARTH